MPTSPSSPKSGRDADEWSLFANDSKDARQFKRKLHTLDIYFWAPEDAKLVVECFKKLLPPNQLDVAELEPEPEQVHLQEPVKSTKTAESAMSPVVQNLENLAVTDAYNDNDRGRRTASPSSSFLSQGVPPPPPPTGHPGHPGQHIHSPSPAISDMSSHQGIQQQAQTSARSTEFTPVAYNPAAPAAPEPIAHREKTPPPEDSEDGTGLAHAARHDQGYRPGPPQGGYQVGHGASVAFGGGYASPPPQQPGYSSPPPHPQSTATYGGFPVQPSTDSFSPPPPSNYGQHGPQSSTTSTAPSFGPGAVSTLSQGQQHSSAAETYVPQRPAQPTSTPSHQFYESLPQGRVEKPLSHVQPQYPDYLSQVHQQSSTSPQSQGSYSQYQYGSSAQQAQQHQNPYDIHQQVYRPTEIEASTHHHSKKPSRSNTNTGDKKESRTDKVEKGVGRLFKKIEKRIG